MPLTGLYHLPLAPTTVSPSARLIAYLSRAHPEQEHLLFTLDHRLFVDTSSQLPGSDVNHRSYTHILSLGTSSATAFVGSSSPENSADLSIITIASSSLSSFSSLLLTKLQPLWYPRQAVVIDRGITLSIKPGVIISIGDLKVAPRQTGAGALRGMLVELYFADEEDLFAPESDYDQLDRADDKLYVTAILNGIFKQIGETVDQARLSVDRTQSRKQNSDRPAGPDWKLAKLYMASLRGAR